MANAATTTDRDVIQAYILADAARTPESRVLLMSTPRGEIDPLVSHALKYAFRPNASRANHFLTELRRRAKTQADYSTLTWRRRIQLTREKLDEISMWERMESKRPYIREYRAELPAYLKDGKVAVLQTWEGPNDIHSIRMVTILNRTEKGWRVGKSYAAYSP